MKDQIADYWNKRANTYSEMINEDMNSFKFNAWSQIIKKNAGNKSHIKALDIGTGPGFFAILMSKLGYDVTAVDCSTSMIEEARSNVQLAGENVKFIKADVENLNMPENSFDLIINRNVTWTLKDPVKDYKAWFNLLKNDGRLLIFDANWYLRLAEPEIEEEYRDDIKLAINMGYDCKTNENQRERCKDIARDLPLTYKFRPDWDEKTLAECGFKNILIEKDISEKIYTESEKAAYKTTPMFNICACK